MSTLTFPAPAGERTGTSDAVLARLAAVKTAPTTHSLLIVDDSDAVREVLGLYAAQHLEICGEALNGRDAVALAAQLQPDAIILDQEMPYLTGIEALPLLRECAPNATVVMYSSGPVGMERRARAAGAAAYFDKSTPPKAVIAAVVDALAAQAAGLD